MGRRGFGMVSARSEIYRLQGVQNTDRERLRSWQYAAKHLAELVSTKKYKAAKEFAEKVAAASIWRDTPFDVPENWNGDFLTTGAERHWSPSSACGLSAASTHKGTL